MYFPYTVRHRDPEGREHATAALGWSGIRPDAGWKFDPPSDLAVRSVQRMEAPVAVTARLHGAERDTLTWLEFEGDYWRPLLPDKLISQLDRGRRSDLLLSKGTWEDYPLHDYDPLTEEPPIPPEWRLCGYDLPERRKAAQSFVDQNIIVVDGLVHKRAPLPVWQVEDLSRPGLFTTRVTLVIPGFEHYCPYAEAYPVVDPTWRREPAAGWLAATDLDIALEASAALYGSAPLHEPENRSTTRGGIVRSRRDGDRVIVHRPLLATDLVEARFMMRLCEKVRESLSPLRDWEKGPGVIRAARALEAAEERLWIVNAHGIRKALDGVAHAMERLQDHVKQDMRSTDLDLGPIRAAMLIRDARAVSEPPQAGTSIRFG